jgi:hypothetical protein
MPRNRVIYQSEALYVSKDASSTGLADHKQLERVQSANYSFSFNRTDINQYGQLGKIDTLQLEPPTVNFDCSYYLTEGFNERALGFYVQTGNAGQGGFISGHLADGSGRNLYILTTSEGTDANGTTVASANNSVIGVGNSYLTDYSVEMAVGSVPTVSLSYEALNIITDADASTVGSAAINPIDGVRLTSNITLPTATTGVASISAIRPGDILIDITNFNGSTLSNLTTGNAGIHIQNASISIPMSRSTLQRLGSKNAYARSTDFPIEATLSVSAIVNDVTDKSLSVILADEVEKDITITLRNSAGSNRMVYQLKNCSLVSESFSSSIGSNKTVDLQFKTSIGGPNDTVNGVFVSGANSTAAF